MHLLRTISVAAAISCLTISSGQASETIKAIKEAKALKACFAESRPLAVRDPATGSWSGYNVRMAQDLAGALGVRLEIVDAPYATIIPSLLGKQCDIAMAPFFANPERAQVVAFTNFYSSQGLKAVVPETSKFKTWEELDDPAVTFAAAAGTQEEAYIKRAFPKAKLKSVVSESSYTFFIEVASGRADAALPDANSASIFLSENPQMKLRVLQPERTANPTGRAYAVRPDEWHLLNFLNIWLAGSKDKFPQQ